MDPLNRWNHIQELFHAALGRPQGERSTYLDQVCGSDESLRDEVYTLLEAHERDGPLDCAVLPHETLSGTVLTGRYQVEREIGRGGMATVYLAQDLEEARRVALKVLRREISSVAERFLREVRTMGELSHPHIVPILDSGQVGDALFYVMPFVGESLRRRLHEKVQLPIAEAVTIAAHVADALAFAHDRGVIHRDIKPDNILLQEEGALVADFGIARAIMFAGGEQLTRTGVAIGTPSYMSPEQVRGERDIDGRTDQYALACVMYEMLVGEPPYTGARPEIIFAKQRKDPVPSPRRLRPEIPSQIDEAVIKALAKDPQERFHAVRQMAAALAG